MAEEVKKTKTTDKPKSAEKEKIDKAVEKEREKSKAALEKEREKQKELINKAVGKEREKQKIAQIKAIDKAVQKERSKIRDQILAGKDPFKDSKPVNKLFLNRAKELLENPSLKDETVDFSSEEKIIVPEQKKSLEDILKEKEENKQEVVPQEEEHYNHVEILRKKREAQMKLNEELKAKENKDADIKAKLQAKALENSYDDKEESEVSEADESLVARIAQLEEDNARLASTIDSLGEELKNKDDLINKQDMELRDKIEKITILSNSIVNDEAPTFEEKNKEIVEEPGIDDDALAELKEQGDIIIRIRLLNERIAEKDAQIKLVEDDLNSLSEQDIFEKEFIQQVKKVREQRLDVVKQANYELDNLAKLVQINEEKMNNKVNNYNEKEAEVKAFDQEYSEKKLNYSEKEAEMKKRSRIIAEFDALSVEVETLKENYKKLVSRYKEILRKAELKVDDLNKLESELIQLYLKKLREQKSNENEDYINQKEEREHLLNELSKLNDKYEEMKANDIDNEQKEALATSDAQLEELKVDLAAIEGKLVLLVTRREERENVDKILRTSYPEVKAYLNAFNEKETVGFEITEYEKKLAKATENLASALEEEKNRIASLCSRYEIIVEENKLKQQYLDGIIGKYDNNEKVIFYKQLIRSLVELDSKEEILRKKAQDLREKINAREQIMKA